jgi:hypothetical protein
VSARPESNDCSVAGTIAFGQRSDCIVGDLVLVILPSQSHLERDDRSRTLDQYRERDALVTWGPNPCSERLCRPAVQLPPQCGQVWTRELLQQSE